MTKEVILTPLAATNYEDIIDYLIAQWGIKVTNNFIARFEKRLFIFSRKSGYISLY